MTTVDEPNTRASDDADVGTTFTLNGEVVTVIGDHEHLLSALRDELDVTSPKDGCSPSGQCGCCTVLIDGKARIACSTLLDKVVGAEVVTLEGLPDDEVQRYADAFAACGALQCGFCTPGIVMRTKALVDKDGRPATQLHVYAWPWRHLCNDRFQAVHFGLFEAAGRVLFPSWYV
ncbi:MAG: 2Fe-2S iron-sulfur cluster-binding protein [Actinomycetota bacterium]